MSDGEIPSAKRWPNRPRLKGFAYDGDHAYHLVFNTASHKAVLIGQLADSVVESIKRAAAATSFDLLVYTVMPNHVHVLVQSMDPDASVIRFVQRCKQRPGFEYRRDTSEQLWLPSFYDRIVRRGDDARQIAAYILANPVRAGLMSEGDLWPYSGGTVVESEIRRS